MSSPIPVTAAEMDSVSFNTSLRGYDIDEVDEFLERVKTYLRRRGSGSGSGSKVVTAGDVGQVTFGTSLRGYNLDEVDEFLDRVVATLSMTKPLTTEEPITIDIAAGEDRTETEDDLDDIEVPPREPDRTKPMSSEEILSQTKKWLKT